MKKFKTFLILLCCTFLFAGCDSEEQKAENEKNLKQAEGNAVNYIEQKYGFKPEIIESELERNQGMFGSVPLTTAMIRMAYNGKEFSVYIDGKNENTDGADNYQQGEIIAALTEKVADTVENARETVGEIKSINIDGGEVQDFFPDVEWNIENLYSAYFDGDNFAEVFGDNLCYVTANYVDANFTSLDKSFFDFILSNERVKLQLISYRTEKDYEERPACNKFDSYIDIEKHAVQIEESLVFEKGNSEHSEYTLGKCDNFYYYAHENKTDLFSFSKTTMPDAKNWDGHGIIGGEFVSPAYRIESAANETVYIYYPLSELTENARIATYTQYGDEEDFYTSPLTDDMGDYRMVYIMSYDFEDGGEKSFAFIDEKEKNENE